MTLRNATDFVRSREGKFSNVHIRPKELDCMNNIVLRLIAFASRSSLGMLALLTLSSCASFRSALDPNKPKIPVEGETVCSKTCQGVAMVAIRQLEVTSGRKGCTGHEHVDTYGQTPDDRGGWIELWTVHTSCGNQNYAVAFNEQLGRVLVKDRATNKEVRLDKAKD